MKRLSFLAWGLVLGLMAAHASPALPWSLDRPIRPRRSVFTHLLGSCSTSLNANPDRTVNINLCARRLNGVVIPPGGRCSFNRVVGPRRASRGFRKAPVLFMDKMEERVGGGACQVSSTLYNAALLSDLTILERSKHTSRVYYLPPGQDATVVYGYKDLVFRNPHPFPVQIRAETTPTELIVSIYGTRSLPYEIYLERRIRTIDPPFGSPTARPGMEIDLYRVRVQNGVERSRERISRDVYPPVKDWDEDSP